MSDTPKIFYFVANNANRRIAGVNFLPVDIVAGTMIGVFATSSADQAKAIAAEPGVREVTQAEFEDYVKKKPLSFSNWDNSRPPILVTSKAEEAGPLRQSPAPASASPAVEKATPPTETPAPAATPATAEEAIKLEVVSPPPKPVETPKRRK